MPAGATPGGCVEIRTSSSQNPVSREGTTAFFFFLGCSCLVFCWFLVVVVFAVVFFGCDLCRGRGIRLLLTFCDFSRSLFDFFLFFLCVLLVCVVFLLFSGP